MKSIPRKLLRKKEYSITRFSFFEKKCTKKVALD
jgi:hypothetical protein